MRRTYRSTVDNATLEAVARYKHLPPLPDVTTLAVWLREVNQGFAHIDGGPGEVWLYCQGAGYPDATWTLGTGKGRHSDDPWPGPDHYELVPGDTRRHRFDAVAAARRLLSEARSAGFR